MNTEPPKVKSIKPLSLFVLEILQYLSQLLSIVVFVINKAVHLFKQKAEAFIWGPWEFNTGASEQVVSNRVSRTRAYSLTTGKNWDLLPLTRTRPGRWMSPTSQDNWRKQYTDQPVRLLITCRRAGHEPWAVPYDAETEPEIEGPYVV